MSSKKAACRSSLSPTDTIQLKCQVHKTHPLDPEGAEEKRQADIRLQTTLIWMEIVLVVKDILASTSFSPSVFKGIDIL